MKDQIKQLSNTRKEKPNEKIERIAKLFKKDNSPDELNILTHNVEQLSMHRVGTEENEECTRLEQELDALLEKQKKLRNAEMLRIFKEFVTLDYEKRFNVRIETIVYAMVGKFFIYSRNI